ncbi:MAG: biotin/lipoyl-binding protein [Saprospiraceae bacterium]|nr:biotin/lipoyl-binding protein [Saprospiraceae bacterium]
MAKEQILSPMPGVVIEIQASAQMAIHKGQSLFVVEAMKMENTILSKVDGVVQEILVKQGEVVRKGQVLLTYQKSAPQAATSVQNDKEDIDSIRPDLQALRDRRHFLSDEARPDAVAKRVAKGQMTARQNLSLLCDEGTFREYGALAVAAQRNRRTEADLIKNTPADGLVCGMASINRDLFEDQPQNCAVMAYDYTVLAGTQGMYNHYKMDRLLGVAGKKRLPVILFAEGGGGRPGDVDVQTVAGLHIMTFYEFAKLDGVVPRISIVSGYCFAGNAALAGASDIIIATQNTSIGMGGPAMVEGGGLGKFHPKEIGPAATQAANGVIDVLVKDEVAAIEAAKQYLAYFQGRLASYEVADQRRLRQLIPLNRKRVFDLRELAETLADKDSVFELGRGSAQSMFTALIRIEGHPVGVIANDAKHEAGAITSDGAAKAVRLLKLCQNFEIPILSLVDTPGIMVGPEAEKSGTVKQAAELFKMGAKLNVPMFAVVLRRAYGLGAMAMTGGSFHAPDFIVSWPSGEFGAMGLEGAIKLGYRKELEAIPDPVEREAAYEKMLAMAYERGKATNIAAYLEIDEVIDPIDTRAWIVTGLQDKRGISS